MKAVRLVLLHAPAPGGAAEALSAAVYESHARLRRALGAPSRLLEPLAPSHPLARLAALARAPPLLLAALGPAAALADGPAAEPPFAAAELFAFESVAALRRALGASALEVHGLCAARRADGVATRYVAVECAPDLGSQFGAAGVAGEPCGLGHDVGLLLTARARPPHGLSPLLRRACDAHADLVRASARSLGYRHALHGVRVEAAALPRAEAEAALAEAQAAELDALGLIAYPSICALTAAAASPAAAAAALTLLRHEARFAHAPATTLTVVRWRPVPHPLSRREAEAAAAEAVAALLPGLALS
jgi:hypothetical protein